MMYLELIDQLMQHFSSGKYQDEAIRAKTEFCRFAGVMDEGMPDYEMKFNQFVDWYLFTRVLPEVGLTPAKLQADSNPMNIETDMRDYFVNLASSRHSLFYFLKLSKQDLVVKDLFGGNKLVIKDSPVTIGFEKDSPFEGRLIPHTQSFVFSNAFCFHPVDAKKFINGEVKKVNKMKDGDKDAAREDLILRLFKMKNRYERYMHVSADQIYSNDPKVKS